MEIFFQNGLWVRRVGQYYFPDGLRCKNSLSRALRWRGGAEWYLSNAEDYWFRHYRPKKGDVILDVGAGHGEDTFAFSQAVGGEGSVIAIEAHPLSFRILHELCRLNGFSNTILLQAAVMDKVGTVSIVEANAWNFHSIDQKTSTNGFKVKSTTLDAICKAKGVNKVDFLKMNIEGAEQYALLGMNSVIQRVQMICVACHDFRADQGDGEQFRTRTMVEQFLTRHGFKIDSRPYDQRPYVRDHIFGLR